MEERRLGLVKRVISVSLNENIGAEGWLVRAGRLGSCKGAWMRR
jgi:hypothetical protein